MRDDVALFSYSYFHLTFDYGAAGSAVRIHWRLGTCLGLGLGASLSATTHDRKEEAGNQQFYLEMTALGL